MSQLKMFHKTENWEKWYLYVKYCYHYWVTGLNGCCFGLKYKSLNKKKVIVKLKHICMSVRVDWTKDKSWTLKQKLNAPSVESALRISDTREETGMLTSDHHLDRTSVQWEKQRRVILYLLLFEAVVLYIILNLM